jgi:Fur family ferric uptake transcriptional regulator
MCTACNYQDLLERSGLGATQHRLQVLKTIGNAAQPLSAVEIHTLVSQDHPINRVTVYRILDNLVDHGLAQRISSAGRAFFYGLAPNAIHSPHPHFYCIQCGRMDCLQPESIAMDTGMLVNQFPGVIQSIEIRVDGVCRQCLETAHI